jgi:hypothetical protein
MCIYPMMYEYATQTTHNTMYTIYDIMYECLNIGVYIIYKYINIYKIYKDTKRHKMT